MAKVLDAECQNGIVRVDGMEVDPALILSEGTKDSTGIALIDGPEVTYITSNASDIKETIEELTGILNQVITVLTGLDGATDPAGTQAASIASLEVLKSQFEARKDSIK